MSPMPSLVLPPQNQGSVSSRHNHKPFAVGIAAGAEDAKYQAKYKELKRKVKDIENDNDKLYFKVLQTKLSIRRMKMERAILYERLSIVPPSPNLQDRLPLPLTGRHHLPAMSQMPPIHPYENTRGHPHSTSHASPPIHSPSSHIRNRSPSRSHIPPQSYRSGGTTTHRHSFPENLPPAQQTSRTQSTEGRSDRLHTHQHLSSAYYSPPPSHKSRPAPDRGSYEHHVASRSREDQGYYPDIHAPSGYSRLSRSGTPALGSASGSGTGVTEVPSRPDSRAQYHEHNRSRSSFRLRPVSQPNEDIDFVHEDSRLQNHPSVDRGAAGVGEGSNL